jgi:nucleotide-binding universal stress UspA family protein
MKKILLPTDYSHNAGYALNFGADIAEIFHARVTLLHTFRIPENIRRNGNDFSLKVMEKNDKTILHQVAERIRKNHGSIRISTKTALGSTVDEILKIVSTHKFEIVVMGRKSKNNFEDLLFGSATLDVARYAGIPVMIIPPEACFNGFKKILLVLYPEQVIKDEYTNMIEMFVNKFQAGFNILMITGKLTKKKFNYDRAISYTKAQFRFSDPSVHFITDDKIIGKVNAFADQNSTDLIIIASKRRRILDRFFAPLPTRFITGETKKPLMLIPL